MPKPAIRYRIELHDAHAHQLRVTLQVARPAATQRAYRQSQIRFYDKHHPGWARLLRMYLRLRGKMPT